MEEKRTAPRFKLNQLIQYGDNREEYMWAEGVDISRGGISCVANESVDPYTEVFFMLRVQGPVGEHDIRGEGSVTYSRFEGGKYRFGIKMERIYDEDKPYLDDFIASLESTRAPLS
jgi:hypothetical protein